MSLKTLVKISRVNNLSDARYCAGMGVEMMGFNLSENFEDRIAPDLFNAMTEWVSGVEFVGEIYGNRIPDLGDYVGITRLQVQDPELIPAAKETGLPLLYRIHLDQVEAEGEIVPLLDRIQLDIEYFLLEAEYAKLDGISYQMVKNMSERYPVILGFGFDRENICEIIRELPVKGVALYGGQEIRPGYRDFDEMADILEVLEEEG